MEVCGHVAINANLALFQRRFTESVVVTHVNNDVMNKSLIAFVYYRNHLWKLRFVPFAVKPGSQLWDKHKHKHKASTTLMRFHLKTDCFRYVFTSRPHCNDRKRRTSFSEMETFENVSESGEI